MTTPDDAVPAPAAGSSTGWPSEVPSTPAPPAAPLPVEPVEPAAAPAAEPVEPAAQPVEPAAPAAGRPGSGTPSELPAPPEPAYEASDPEPVEAAAPAYPALDAPALDTPALDTPALDTPALDTPALDTPADITAEGEIPPPPPAPRSPSPLRSAPVLALLLMTILMTAATAVVWYQVHRHDQTESARRAGLETSRDAARVLFSYDYRTLPKDFAAGKAITTGKFQAQYSDTTSKVVTPVATQKKAVVKAEVVTAGVVRASPDTVVTIVYVNQVTTSSLQAGPKVDLSRVRMTVKHVGGRWLVSNVEAL